jgi:hypothetical protein
VLTPDIVARSSHRGPRGRTPPVQPRGAEGPCSQIDILDFIDKIVPPGTDVGTLDQAYKPLAPGEPWAAPPAPVARLEGFPATAGRIGMSAAVRNVSAAGPERGSRTGEVPAA